MDHETKRTLQIMAVKVRMGIIEGVYHAKSGHPGGSLSIADTLTYLYSQRLRYRVDEPDWADRDRLVLSKGHAAPALYATLAEVGFFPTEELKTLRHLGSRLQGHPDMKHIPGVDMSSGSLAQGISAACGMAMAARLNGQNYRTYVILGDGEIEEGQVWEAAMFAGHRKLPLVAVVDHNGLQIDGTNEEVCALPDIAAAFAGFGWHTVTADAHDFDSLEAAFLEADKVTDRPTVIVQESTKGKGVTYMENEVDWHGVAPKEEDYKRAMAELTAALAELEG